MSPRRAALTGLAAAVFTASAVGARSRRVSLAEERTFRSVNDAPDALHLVVWPVMQMGSLGSVFVTAEILRRRHPNPRSAMVVAAAGTAVWGGIKLVKPLVGRGRPDALLSDVRVRGPAQTGLGYPSGHAAVSVTLGILATRSPGARAVALSAAVLTGLSRIYVGAHLPLDVLGGFAAGCVVGLATDQTMTPVKDKMHDSWPG